MTQTLVGKWHRHTLFPPVLSHERQTRRSTTICPGRGFTHPSQSVPLSAMHSTYYRVVQQPQDSSPHSPVMNAWWHRPPHPPFGPTVVILPVLKNGRYSWPGSARDLRATHEMGFSQRPVLGLAAGLPRSPCSHSCDLRHSPSHSASTLEPLTPSLLLLPLASHAPSNLPSQHRQENSEPQPAG